VSIYDRPNGDTIIMKTSTMNRETKGRKHPDIDNADNHKAKRAEILFFYDAKLRNPNGDPDENRPRKDELTERIFVTEFRLKRTIRDYLIYQNSRFG
jgi:hypothetical protein